MTDENYCVKNGIECDHGTGNYLFSDALALINQLEEENADKERYIIELYNRAREAEREVKDTAKDILQRLAQFRAVSPTLSKTWYALAEKYGVEVE